MTIQQLLANKPKLARNLSDSSSRAESGFVMTRAGLNLLAKGIAGKQITYTKAAIGDSSLNGTLIELTDSELVEQTGLINPVAELPLVSIENKDNGTAVVSALLNNATFQNLVFVREMGLFARDPDTNQEILYSYQNTGAVGFPVPSSNGAVVMQLVLDLVTVVDNAQNITAVLDASLVFVNQAQLIEHIYAENPHPNITFPDYTNSFNQIDGRLAQVENNVANLFTQLGAPDANLIIFEDFKDLSSVDALKVKVTNTVSGTPDVYVESLDGIIAGHYYNLSDGVRSWYIRSKALASNDGLFSVIFDSNITQTFNLNKTYLYRSTAIIEDGQASGSSKEYESVFAPDFVFQGVSAASTQTLTLNTSQAAAANFELSEAGGFNSEGYFVIL